MKRSHSLRPIIFVELAIIFLFYFFSQPATFAQLAAVENKIPKNVPLEIELKNFDRKDWWNDLEVKVTNAGKKPIHYLWLILWLDVTDQNGKQRAVSFKFGDAVKYYSTESEVLGREDDPAILPEESYIFAVDPASIKFWNLLQKRNEFIGPKKGTLDHGFTSFGDGTGFLAGGTPFKKKG